MSSRSRGATNNKDHVVGLRHAEPFSRGMPRDLAILKRDDISCGGEKLSHGLVSSCSQNDVGL